MRTHPYIYVNSFRSARLNKVDRFPSPKGGVSSKAINFGDGQLLSMPGNHPDSRTNSGNSANSEGSSWNCLTGYAKNTAQTRAPHPQARRMDGRHSLSQRISD